MNSKKKKIIRVVVALMSVVLLGLIAVAVDIGKKVEEIEVIEVEEETIEESITEEVEHKTGYLNVAVFGIDSRKGELGKGNLSDTILIASLNHETMEVKMVSVYRDTLVKLKNGSYNKANSAYSISGPDGAIHMINENLDMNIEKYVTVNFNALVDVIDALGGLDLELTAEEVVHMNNYCVETSKVTGKKYKKIEPEKAGTYHLNGVQAVSYSRIRQTAGDDAMRTHRQRVVITKMMEKMQTMNLATIYKLVDTVLPQVATNFKVGEVLSYAKDFKKYGLADTMGFPNERTSRDLYKIGSAEIANTLASNSEEVHKFLFDDEEYEASSKVKAIDKEIKSRLASGYYDAPKPKKEEEKKEDKKEENMKEDTKEDKKEDTKTDNKKENPKQESNKKPANNSTNKEPSKKPENSGNTEPTPPKKPVFEEEFYDGD